LEVAVAIGVDPIVIMAAALLQRICLEWLFAGLYSGSDIHLAKYRKTVDLEVPTNSEFVIEDDYPGETAIDGRRATIWEYYGPMRENTPLVRFHCMTPQKAGYMTSFGGRPQEDAMMAFGSATFIPHDSAATSARDSDFFFAHGIPIL
jgi:4-hydroxy-3-polyprenylbenzoate decarboxylase